MARALYDRLAERSGFVVYRRDVWRTLGRLVARSAVPSTCSMARHPVGCGRPRTRGKGQRRSRRN